MADLSPQSQAVLDAYVDEDRAGRLAVAAVLLAAADQVVPVCSTKSDRGTQRMMIRNNLLAIADELEAHQ